MQPVLSFSCFLSPFSIDCSYLRCLSFSCFLSPFPSISHPCIAQRALVVDHPGHFACSGLLAPSEARYLTSLQRRRIRVSAALTACDPIWYSNPHLFPRTTHPYDRRPRYTIPTAVSPNPRPQHTGLCGMSVDWQRGFLGPFLSKSGGKDYVPLRTSEEHKEEVGADMRPGKKSKWYIICVFLVIITSMIGSGGIGFALGNRRWSVSRGNGDGFTIRGDKVSVKDTDRGRLFDTAGKRQISNGVQPDLHGGTLTRDGRSLGLHVPE